MPGTIVSLYIDDVSLRLMVTRGKRIATLAETPLDTSLGDIDTKEKEAQLADIIKNLLKSNKVTSRKIVLGLSGLHCLTRPLVLPQLPRAMLKEAITREAQRVLPVPIDQLYLSWQVISTLEDKLYVYIVALPREMADMVVRVVNQAGYKPYLMDIKPMALARLCRESNAVVIDVQAKEFDIIIISDNIPQPVRTVSFPSEALSLEEKFDVIEDDLKRTMQFYNKNNADKAIQPDATLLVSGDLATAPELYEPLAKELGLKAELLASPLKSMKDLDASHYLANVGLTLKEIPREAGPLLPNLNVLPSPYQPKQVSMRQVMAVPAVAIAIALIVMMIMTVQETAANIDFLNTQIITNNFTLEKSQAQKRVLMNNVSDLQSKIAMADTLYSVYANAFIDMNKTGDLMNTDLNTMVDNVVDELNLATLVHAGGQISIDGSASSEQLVLEYVRDLLATNRFDEITIVNITRAAIGEEDGEEIVTYGFSLKCYLKDGRP
ncbi:MAG: pilus assembly protein PilM [Dehalococcoidales bacterium]|nr:pilus assembly protein PilM [Dehalococcoidales bacterium]